MRRPAALRRAFALATVLAAGGATAAPLSQQEIVAACSEAEGPAHCGRLIEQVQVKRLPNLVVRDGRTLVVRLYPAGEIRLQDRETVRGGTSYALFDYINELNAVVLWVTQDDDVGFLVVQRGSGRQTTLPAAPVVSPDRSRIATADFCSSGCENAVSLWRVGRDDIRRESSWKPAEAWSDASVRWKDADTLLIEYLRAGEDTPRELARRVGDASWVRAPLR
jgi:hypothetical protein